MRAALDGAREREDALLLASDQARALHEADLLRAETQAQHLASSLAAAQERVREHEAAAHQALEHLEGELQAARALLAQTQSRLEEAEGEAERASEREVLICAEATAAREQAQAARAEVVLLEQREEEAEEALRQAQDLSAQALMNEREKTGRARKEAEAARDAYAMEKALREKIAAELFAEIDARKEAERRQAYALAALHEQVKRQIAAIVELDEALKQEVLLRSRLEEQVEGERAARAKAEDALHKLDQLFRAAGADDSDWAIVDDDNDSQGTSSSSSSEQSQ